MSVVETRIRFGRGSVHVRAVGAGPPVLLINGLSLHTATWEVLERTLGGHRIIEFDLPGSGRSYAPKLPVSVRSLAELATRVLDRFDVDRADVLGHSMGGMIAQQLAADAPDRVRRLVLAATTPGIGGLHGNYKAMLALAAPLRFISARAHARSLATITGGRGRRDAGWIEEQSRLFRQVSSTPTGYLGQLTTMAPWSGLPRLGAITHPTLVIAGDDDPLTPVANGMLLARHLADARLLVLRDEGHLMLLDAASGAQWAVADFLAADEVGLALAWRRAISVSAEQLQGALEGAGRQLSPWGAAGSWARKRWPAVATAVPAAGPDLEAPSQHNC